MAEEDDVCPHCGGTGVAPCEDVFGGYLCSCVNVD